MIGGLLAALLLVACVKTIHSPQGFRLPDGDVEAGQKAFVSVGCIRCHTVAGEELPTLVSEREMEVELGGRVAQVETYAELVTSIIYPQHAIKASAVGKHQDEQGRSLMPDLTENMTVRQMIDIAEYLQSHYTLEVPAYPEYPFSGSYYP